MNGADTEARTRRRRRRLRMAVALLGALALAPFAALHAVAFLFSMRERSFPPVAEAVLPLASGVSISSLTWAPAKPVFRVVYVHGTPATGRIFKEQFEHPFPEAALTTFDRPGFGRSADGGRPPSLEAQAEALSALMPSPQALPVVLVGHSYGAPVALLAALRRPDVVAGVVLVGGCVNPALERPLKVQWIGNWPVLSWLLPAAFRRCNQELLALRKDLERLRPEISGIQVPVVMVHGSADRQVPVENVAWLRAELARSGKERLFDALILTNASHFIPWEHPEAVAEGIRRVRSMAVAR